MKRAIVSGASGFMGSAVTRELLGHGYQVFALIHGEKRGNLPDHPALSVFSWDLSQAGQLSQLLPAGGYDAFYHFAWVGSAGAARMDATLQLQNAWWTVQALEVSQALGCRRFVCAGSIMEEETLAAVYTQGNRMGPGAVYGGGKVAAHIMCKAAAAKLETQLIWTQITNAYGPGETSPRLVNSTLRGCLKGKPPQFTSGAQNYDFVYIGDAARAFRLIGERGKPFHQYLIGSSHPRPLREFLLEMQQAVAPHLPFLFGDLPFVGVDLPLSRFDCSETEAHTGFRAQVSFGEGCQKTMEWLKSTEEELT